MYVRMYLSIDVLPAINSLHEQIADIVYVCISKELKRSC